MVKQNMKNIQNFLSQEVINSVPEVRGGREIKRSFVKF